jgi:PleD family two-component response regulator
MRASNTKMLIVGEKESTAQYEEILRSNGFRNINKSPDPTSALQNMERDPPDVVIAETKLRDMDAFEFAANIREIERSEGRYTYILIIDDESGGDNSDYFRLANVDTIVLKGNLPIRFIPQVMSGERMSLLTNSLLERNRVLQERCEQLEPGQLLDPLTGLGNRRQAMSGIEDMIKQIEGRGGVIVVFLIRLDNHAELMEAHGEEIVGQMVVGFARKIRRLTRPLDIVARIDAGLFAIVMHHDEMEHCRPESYARFKISLEKRSYRVRSGYLLPEVCVGACGASAETGPPKADSLIAVALSNLTNISESDEINVSILNRM